MSVSTGALVRETITIDVGHLSAGQRARLTELIAEALHRVADPESAPMVLGWTAVTFQQALGRLEAASAGVQANVIREALRQGGFVSREAVYQLAQYPAGPDASRLHPPRESDRGRDEAGGVGSTRRRGDPRRQLSDRCSGRRLPRPPRPGRSACLTETATSPPTTSTTEGIR